MSEAAKNKGGAGDAPLKNIRHERFCRYYAGENAGDAASAYRNAGFALKSPAMTVRAAAELLQRPEIMARVARLRRQPREQRGVDRDWICRKRLEIIETAEKDTVKLAALRDLERGLAPRDTGDVSKPAVGPTEYEPLTENETPGAPT